MATQIDDNFENVAIAVDDSTGEPRPLLVDPVTGYLLVKVIEEVSAAASPSSKIDENFEGVATAEDSTTGDIKPLIVHPTSGGLLCNNA